MAQLASAFDCYELHRSAIGRFIVRPYVREQSFCSRAVPRQCAFTRIWRIDECSLLEVLFSSELGQSRPCERAKSRLPGRHDHTFGHAPTSPQVEGGTSGYPFRGEMLSITFLPARVVWRSRSAAINTRSVMP